jgi:hypothetical protein
MCNLIHARKKSVALPTAIFTKFTNAQRHYEQISYIDFHKNRETIAESTYRNYFTPLSIAISEPIFTKLISLSTFL